MDYEDEDGLSKLLNMDMSGLSFDGVDLSALEGMDLSGLGDIDLSGINFDDFGGIDPSVLEGLGLSQSDDGGGGGDGVIVGGPIIDEARGGGSDTTSDYESNFDDIDSILNNAGRGSGGTRSLFGGDTTSGQGSESEGFGPLLTPDGVDENTVLFGESGIGSSGYYDEETGRFIYDENGGLRGPLDEKSGTNLESMDGYTYDKKTGTWTTPRGETYTPKTPPSHTAKSGAQVMVNAGALPSGYNGLTPEKGSTADTSRTGTSGKDSSGNKSSTGDKKNDLSFLLPLLLAMMAMNRGGGSSSSGAVIPLLSADRKQLPYGPSSGEVKRPGAGGTTYFSPTTYTKKAAGGGMMYGGGGISNLGGYSDGGRLLRGPGDGVSDSIPATIGGKQPARLATGEFVVPARIVSELGNGSTEAGAKKLYAMMDRVQKARRKTKNVAADTKAHKYLPA